MVTVTESERRAARLERAKEGSVEQRFASMLEFILDELLDYNDKVAVGNYVGARSVVDKVIFDIAEYKV